MTQPPDEYGDLLRRALRAEADAVVPSPEGLEIIRARIDRRGVRNLFWWRAGAAAASAILVAGTIVMAVPQLRSQITNEPAYQVNDETSEVPSNSSTTRSQQPPPKQPSAEPPPVVIPDVSRTPSPRPTKKAESTSRPSQSPSPRATTECPTPAAEQEQPPEECPTVSPTPTPTDLESTAQPSACPPEECPPDDVTDAPTTEASPLVDASQTTP
ncbi:hypothetical protein [Nonomuraea zeae]|uniref:Uncharacterized protein n=1 Tax=Nonomuraea zeae TaxID=1642303 RepID=A0A5S4G2V9_9ACTN|nr:hypothetical protein [Nonomuraea zeae]TMR27333.1 hypothetical protein ETD85_39460 [Nonomuraea zeae]